MQWVASKHMIAGSLSHYRILEELGAGGMGVVYKARDTRLDRVVALKILPKEFISDPARKQRFVTEAKAASALNHPNIVTIHDIGSDGGTDFIAMEYVSGSTLEQSIARKPLPINETLGYATQIADALAAAHRAGIVHRDLKPGNIMITAHGRIKLLDFGLAKLMEPRIAPLPAESSPTRTMEGAQHQLTQEGQIIGTIAYMSPEQLMGGALDARTDLFAFGIVLYEMLTGRRPFSGSTTIETAAQILKNEPKAPSELVEGIPPALERILGHCLRKNPEERFQSIADVARLLEDLRADLASGRQVQALPSITVPRRRNAFLAVANLVVLAIAGFLAWRLIRPTTSNLGPVLTRLTFDSGLSTDPAISPDGGLLAYASDRDGRGNLDIWVRQLAGGEPIQVTRDPADESEPAFSADGTKIAYRSNRGGGGIYVTSALGGGSEPQMLATGGHAPRFSPDGKWITFYTGDMSSLTRRPMRSKLFLMNLSSGQTRQIQPQLAAAYDAIWSPDSKHILFSGSAIGHVKAPIDWYVIPVNGGNAIPTGAVDILSGQGLSDVIPHVWADGNDVLFSAAFGDSRNIWRQSISGQQWHAKGAAKRLTSGTGIEAGASLVSLLPSKRLVFSVLSSRINLWTLPLDRSGIEPNGNLTRLTDDEAAVGFHDLTADGNLLVFSSNQSGATEVWSRDLTTGKEIRLTGGTADEGPTVDPAGSRFAYSDGSEIYVGTMGATGAHGRSRRKIRQTIGWPYSWSPDGEWLFYAMKPDYWGVDATHISSGRTYTVFQPRDYDLTYLHASPDNRWVAASAFQDPVSRVQVARFREAATIQAKDWFSIADDAAQEDWPMWSSDGKLVYYTSYRDGFRCIWAQLLDNDTKRPSGPPVAVYHSHSARVSLRNAGLDHLKISVARDKLVFNMGELRGNLWMATFRD